MQLKKRLWNKPYCNDLHFFLFGMVALFISFSFPFFYIVLGVYLIYIYKKTKYLIPLLIILLVLGFSYQISKLRVEEQEPGIYEETYSVLDVSDTSLILKGSTKIIVYSVDNDLKPGDLIQARVKIKRLNQASYAGDFDERSYYMSKGITNRGVILNYELKGNHFTLASLKYRIIQYYENHLEERSLAYVKTLFLGISSLDRATKNAYASLYLSHLLVVSGFHIMLIYKALLFFLQKVCKIKGEGITLAILGIYILFIGLPTSSLRAYLVLLLSVLNKRGEMKYTRLDIFSLSFIIVAFLFPLRVSQTGFILSYLISFLFVFKKEFMPSSSRWVQRIVTQFLCIGIILPFLINQSFEVSIIGMIVATILGLEFGKLLLILVFSMILFPGGFYEAIFLGYDQFLLNLSNLTYPIRFPYMSALWMGIYYGLFLFCLFTLVKKRRRWMSIILLIFFLFCVREIRYVDGAYRVTYIDVGQGDSIFIELPYGQGTVLIDSFGRNTKFILSRGLKRIDYVILTHFDQDHMGSIQEVVDTFDVGCVLYSPFGNATKITSLEAKKKAVSVNEVLYIGNTRFDILGPIHPYTDSNSNSIVVQANFGGYTFLFTGDMTEKEEQDLIAQYGKKLDSDVLKVAHHGSKASTSKAFLDYVSPEIAIISVGEDNIYGLPNTEIVERLRGVNLYMTSVNGNIEVVVKKKLAVNPYRS